MARKPTAAAIAKALDGATQDDGRNIFFFWDDPDRLPEAYRDNIETIRKQNPGWSVQLVGDAEIAALLAETHPEIAAVYGDIRVPACRSDIGRLLLLHRYGGWYLDSDMACREGLDHFGMAHPIVFRRDDTDGMRRRFRTMNGIMFMPRGHGLPGRMLEAVTAHVTGRRHLHDVLAFAGPKLLSETVQAMGFTDREILSVRTYLRGRDAFFQEMSSDSSFSWRIQMCFGILPGTMPNWDIFPPVLRDRFAAVIRDFVTRYGLEPWVPELALRRPAYMRDEGFAALVRDCGPAAYAHPLPFLSGGPGDRSPD